MEEIYIPTKTRKRIWVMAIYPLMLVAGIWLFMQERMAGTIVLVATAVSGGMMLQSLLAKGQGFWLRKDGLQFTSKIIRFKLRWDEIVRIEHTPNYSLILIYVSDPAKHFAGMRPNSQRLLTITEKKLGTPFTLNPNFLDCSGEELYQKLMNAYRNQP